MVEYTLTFDEPDAVSNWVGVTASEKISVTCAVPDQHVLIMTEKPILTMIDCVGNQILLRLVKCYRCIWELGVLVDIS